MNYRSDIDGLRTLAVVPVVLFHAGVAGFGGGFVGVDIFFVISGYLITSIIHQELVGNHFSVAKFYERRARRILPALFAVIFSCLFAGWFLLVPDDYEQMAQSILSALFFFSNIWFWQNSGDYFQGATDYLPMLHTWSLAVEEQFYIFFPLLLMVLHRVGRRFVMPATLVVVVFSFILAVWATPAMPSASFYLLPTRLWELGFGSLLALGLAPMQMGRNLRELLAAAGLLAIALPVFIYDRNTSFPGLGALPPVAGTALIIWAGATGPTMVSRFLSLRPVVFIGLLSYSLYLWHWPIMAFARNWLFSVELPHAWQAGTVTASFIAAWVSWRFIEQPFRKPSNKGGLTRKQIFAGSGIGMASLGFLAGTIILSSGAASLRFSEEQLALAKNVVKRDKSLRKNCWGARPADKLCEFGQGEESTGDDWLLWGDSHALTILPTMINIADQHQRKLIFASKGNCPPLPQVDRSDMPQVENESCEIFREGVLGRIITGSEIDTVILIARWPLYETGVYLQSEGGRSLKLVDSGNRREDNEVMYDALLRLVSRINDAGKKVVLVESAPEIPWDVGTRMKAYVLLGRPMPADPELKEIAARHEGANKVLQQLAAVTNATIVPMVHRICTPVCPTHDSMSAFYEDNNHLTPEGARKIMASLLEEAMTTVTGSAGN